MVGPMNLAYPENWQGPYMVQHPTYGGIDYQIVRTDAGYFIAPYQNFAQNLPKDIDVVLVKQ